MQQQMKQMKNESEFIKRKAQLEAVVTPLLPVKVVHAMNSGGNLIISPEAADFVNRANGATLADAGRSVVSQWCDYTDSRPARFLRSHQPRLKDGGYMCREPYRDDAFCFCCGEECGGGRFECLQGEWVSSCGNHITWGMADVQCIYGCDSCVHDLYQLGDIVLPRIRMACDCVFLADSMSRMND